MCISVITDIVRIIVALSKQCRICVFKALKGKFDFY